MIILSNNKNKNFHLFIWNYNLNNWAMKKSIVYWRQKSWIKSSYNLFIIRLILSFNSFPLPKCIFYHLFLLFFNCIIYLIYLYCLCFHSSRFVSGCLIIIICIFLFLSFAFIEVLYLLIDRIPTIYLNIWKYIIIFIIC